MKKKMMLLSAMLVVLMFLIGCGATKSEIKQTETPKTANQKEFDGAPKWVVDSQVEGGIAGVGQARIGAAGIPFAKTEALAYARVQLAKNVEVKAMELVKRFMSNTGIGKSETVDNASAHISKEVVSQNISGSKHRDTWISPNDNLYVLVVIDNSIAGKSIKEQTLTSFKNDQALYQEFKAKNGQEELDKEIAKFEESKKK